MNTSNGCFRVSSGNLLADSWPHGQNQLTRLPRRQSRSACMPQPHADRNLLFGILALQMDFISRDALVAAMHAWVLDKGKPLGQILLQQNALSEEEHALLEALGRKHLEKHNNDPQQSLAALSSVGSARRQLEQVADPDVQASLAHVSSARAEGRDDFATRQPSVPLPPLEGSRFR